MENGEWGMENGEWGMENENGEWRMGKWRVGKCMFRFSPV